MMPNNCPQEDAVAQAARSGRWNETLAQHARQCPACREISLIGGWMNHLAVESAESRPLPEASLLWWKHELLERDRRRERALRPVQVMDAVSAMLFIVAAAAALLVATSLAQEMISLAARNTPQFLLATVTGGSGSLLHAVLLGTLVAMGAGAALLYPLLMD